MSERILIVEDNLALAENVAELLREEADAVLVASDAGEAEALAREHGFDLAVVDIRLAGVVSGLDLVPRLRRHSAHGEILLMTGDATLDTAIQAIRRGVYAYITKPFAPDQLITLVKRALAQVALKREKQALSQRLEASEALYRGLVESVEACIVGLDGEGIVRFCNRFMAERVGAPQASLVGRPFASLCDARDGREVAQAIAWATGGHTVRDQECRLVGAGGRPRTVRWTLTPLETAGLEAAQRAVERGGLAPTPVVLAAGIDITDRLDLERKTAEAEVMAAMGVLTTGLAHEIRNPLNAAKLQIELLIRRAKRVATPEAQAQLAEPAQLVKAEIDRLSGLLEEFLDLARPRPIERREHGVRELFDGVLALEQPVVQGIGATICSEVSPPDLKVRADADKMRQVLINFVRNSIDALRETSHGNITLRGEVSGENVSLAVEDNGPGVSAELAATAFKPFVTSKPAGTGLGLAIVQKIVAQHGGTVELVAREGGGTVARLFLPR